MTNALYLRLKSLNTRTVRGVTSPKNIVRVAALHNLRELAAELGASAASGINPARTHLNYQLRGPATADEVAALALALLDNAGVTTLRRDACMALELVVSLPAETAIDHREYFGAAVAWADAYFNVPILSAAAHLDEAAPHCHILLLPLVAGRMQGGALAGGPAKIRAMLADFQQQVAQRFGLTHQPRAKRLSKPNRDAAGRMVLEALRARPERLSEPAMRGALIAALGSQAEPLLALLGLSMPTAQAKAKSFADIMTAPCKLERARRPVPNTKCIDVAQNSGNQDGEKFDNVYHCVHVAPPAPASPADFQRQQATPSEDALESQHISRADQRQPSACSASAAQPRQQAAAGADIEQAATSAAAHQPVAIGIQNIMDTPPADQRQQSSSASPAPRVSIQAVTSAQHQAEADAGNFPGVPSARCTVAPESVCSAAGHQPPATPTNKRAEGHGPASHAKRSSARPAPRKPAPAADDSGYTRCRDADQPAEHWDSDRGEFMQATGPPGGIPGAARAQQVHRHEQPP